MRVMGALLLTAACLVGGLMAAGTLRERVRQREAICRLLACMEYEIARFRTPFPELFAALEKQSADRCAELCRRICNGLAEPGDRRFAEHWAYAVEALDPRERALVLPLGLVLGRYGAEEQLCAVSKCRDEMERALAQARQAVREKSGICVGLSAAVGVVLSVLLL